MEKAVFAKICHIEVGRAIVVEVGNSDSEAPAIVCYSGFSGDICESAVVIIVEESSVGTVGFAFDGVVSGPFDEVEYRPSHRYRNQ